MAAQRDLDLPNRISSDCGPTRRLHSADLRRPSAGYPGQTRPEYRIGLADQLLRKSASICCATAIHGRERAADSAVYQPARTGKRGTLDLQIVSAPLPGGNAPGVSYRGAQRI